MERLLVVRHLTANQAWARYQCHPPVEKTRRHATWLLLRADQPHTPAQVAAVVGLSIITVRDVLKRWNEHGPDGRKNNDSFPSSVPTSERSCWRR